MFLSRIELGPRAAESASFWREVGQPYGAHQALWRLLSRSADQPRDFLYRAEESRARPSFLVLSAARPETSTEGLWLVEPKPFAPALRAGQRLGFRLRASPVVRRGERLEGKRNKKIHRHDAVYDHALRLKASGMPVPDAATLARDAGLAWLGAQGARSGFALVETRLDEIGEDGLLQPSSELRRATRVEGYRQHRITRSGEHPIQFSTLDFEGLLEVTDPNAFLARVRAGFGPQKAFGCGLMLLRRA